jgi:hypothetical protein
VTTHRSFVAGACALVLAACSTAHVADPTRPGEVVLVLDKAPT